MAFVKCDTFMTAALTANAYSQLLMVKVGGICAAERTEAVKDLERRIEELTSSRSSDVSKALAQQSEEVDFLKAELTSTKVRLHDALSHSRAEKDALIRHADASRAELLQQLEAVQRDFHPVDETEKPTSVTDTPQSPHITPNECQSVEALWNEHVPETEAVSRNVDNGANLRKKLELLRELVKSEKVKLKLQQTGASDSQRVHADGADGTVNEVAHSHTIRSSWAVLDEQVLPLIEKLCTAVDQNDGPSNSEAVNDLRSLVENPENRDGDGKIVEQDQTVQSVRGRMDDERQEVIDLNAVVDKMQDSVRTKDEALREIETKYCALQTELDSVREQLLSREKLTEDLSANVESIGEQLKCRTAELSDKDTDIQKLNAEVAELKGEITQKLLQLQTDCDEKLDSERKTWQAEIDAKTDEVLAKCAELEQRESTLKALSHQCSMLMVERDAKIVEVANCNSQIDSLSRELGVIKEQLNDKTTELHEAQTRIEHDRKLLKDETESETLGLKSKITALQDEMSTLRQQLEKKSVDLVNKDGALSALENRRVSERGEFQTRIAGLEDQLSSDQKLSLEKLDVLAEEVKAKEAATREHEESHAVYCKLTDAKLTDLTAAVSAREDEIRSLLEQHQAELLEQSETFNGEMAKLTNTNEEQIAHLTSQIDELTKDKKDLTAAISAKEDEIRSLLERHKAEVLEQSETFSGEMAKLTNTNEEQIAHLTSQIDELIKNKKDLESELQLLTDKLKSESERVALLETEIAELSSAKEECERQLEDLRRTVTGETEDVIKLRDGQITALKSALLDKDRSLSLLNTALSQACAKDVRLLDSSSGTVVTAGDDGAKNAEVSDAGSGDAGRGAPQPCDEQSCARSYDVSMMLQQINSLGAANATLRERIGGLEADLLQIKQTVVKPVDESRERELPSHSSGQF